MTQIVTNTQYFRNSDSRPIKSCELQLMALCGDNRPTGSTLISVCSNFNNYMLVTIILTAEEEKNQSFTFQHLI